MGRHYYRIIVLRDYKGILFSGCSDPCNACCGKLGMLSQARRIFATRMCRPFKQGQAQYPLYRNRVVIVFPGSVIRRCSKPLGNDSAFSDY